MNKKANDKVARLNALSQEQAARELLKCCGSTKWAERMAALRPFQSLDALLLKADGVWWDLKAEDWLEAFAQHPEIGERKGTTINEGLAPAQSGRWSEEEQLAIRGASKDTMLLLESANAEYAEKFGFIFIVCATGKTASEMLKLLKERLTNEPKREIRISAGEQARITQLRLKKLVD